MTDTTTEPTRTTPSETHVVIVGTYRGTDVPADLEHLTPDYVLADRVTHWTERGWRDVHAALQVMTYHRLTAAQAEALRTPPFEGIHS